MGLLRTRRTHRKPKADQHGKDGQSPTGAGRRIAIGLQVPKPVCNEIGTEVVAKGQIDGEMYEQCVHWRSYVELLQLSALKTDVCNSKSRSMLSISPFPLYLAAQEGEIDRKMNYPCGACGRLGEHIIWLTSNHYQNAAPKPVLLLPSNVLQLYEQVPAAEWYGL